MKRWFKALDFFVPGLFLMVILARLYPGPAVHDGPVTLHLVKDIGVTLVFLFYGLRLNPSKFRQDLGNWKLHLLIQATTFILFPLLILPFMPDTGLNNSHLLWLGFFFLAALPSTVSSSVVMISIARGNVPGGIFNASVSSIAGILITPFWMSVVLSMEVNALHVTGVVGEILARILLPVLVGVGLNRFFGDWARRNVATTKLFDQATILLIVYLSFGTTFYEDLFESTRVINLIVIVLSCATLFGVVFGFLYLATKKMKFNREDRITALFAGSQKSLVHGSVMAGIIFSGTQALGLILLPIMIYHTLQLVISSAIAKRLGLEAEG